MVTFNTLTFTQKKIFLDLLRLLICSGISFTLRLLSGTLSFFHKLYVQELMLRHYLSTQLLRALLVSYHLLRSAWVIQRIPFHFICHQILPKLIHCYHSFSEDRMFQKRSSRLTVCLNLTEIRNYYARQRVLFKHVKYANQLNVMKIIPAKKQPSKEQTSKEQSFKKQLSKQQPSKEQLFIEQPRKEQRYKNQPFKKPQSFDLIFIFLYNFFWIHIYVQNNSFYFFTRIPKSELITMIATQIVAK